MRIAKVVLEKLNPPDEGVPIYLNTYDDPPIPHKTGSRDDSFLMPVDELTLGRDEIRQEDFCLAGFTRREVSSFFHLSGDYNAIV